MKKSTKDASGYTALSILLLMLGLVFFQRMIWLKYLCIIVAVILLSIVFFRNYTIKRIRFNNISTNEINNSGYAGSKEVVIDIRTANLYAILSFLPILFIFGSLFILIWWKNGLRENIHQLLESEGLFYLYRPIFALLLILTGIIVHELLHGLVFAIYSKNGIKSIRFGIMWRAFSPYCHGKEPLKVWQYRIGTLLPGIVLGVIPLLVSFFTGNLAFFGFGMLFTVTAMGDFLIIWMLRKYKSSQLVLDHPEKVGFYIID